MPVFADTLSTNSSLEKKTLLINIDREFPPFEFINEDGEADGLNVELVRKVMKRLNQPCEFHIADWSDILKNFEEEKTDLLIGITNTPERKSKMNFAISHSEIYLEIISHKNHPIKDVNGLVNKKIIVQQADWAHDYLKANHLTQDVTLVKTVEEGLSLFDKGEHDAFFCTDIVTRFNKKRERLKPYIVSKADINPLPYSMAFHKDDERLLYMVNRTLYELKIEGEYDALYDKWMGIYHKDKISVLAKNLLVGFSFVALLLGIFVFILRQRVKRATYNLYKSQKHLRDANFRLKLSLDAGRITPFTWYIETDQIHVSFQKMDEELLINEPFHEIVALEKLINFFKPEFIPQLSALFEKIKAGDKEIGHIEVSADQNGNIVYFDLNLMIQEKDSCGIAKVVIGHIQDITERKKAELALADAKERAERSDRFKSAFMANMSHEIRTPLNSIVGFSQLMRSAETEEEKDTYLQVIHENNTHLLKLINDVLDLSKIEAGYIEFINKSFYLNGFMEELYCAFEPATLNREVKLKVDKPAYDCFIEFDKERLSQILSNLLSNALKFTQYGSVTFGYNVEETGVRFYVCDTGIGISADYQQKIFERFEKVNSFAPGSGLGLSICKSIVDSVGGTLKVTSRLGKGSCFEVWLPCIPQVIDEKELESLLI